MDFELRQAVQDDLPRIRALFAEMMRAIDPEASGVGYAQKDVAYYFSGGEDWICVAEQDGQVVAFLSMEVHREAEHYIYLDDFCVDASHRGQGIGTALLASAENFTREIGFPLIVLHVKITNERARRLYEKTGYAVLDDDGDRYRMIKRI